MSSLGVRGREGNRWLRERRGRQQTEEAGCGAGAGWGWRGAGVAAGASGGGVAAGGQRRRRGAAAAGSGSRGGAETPRIAVLSTVVGEPATQMPLQIRIAPTESIPRNSFLRLRGLPPTASLSEGHSIAPGAWAIPLNGLPRLRLNLPASIAGKSDLSSAWSMRMASCLPKRGCRW